MCGIAGYYSANKVFNEAHLRNMTSLMAHRGPDAEGFFMDDKVGLGHKRLSIIDLSDSANQPMFAQNNNYVIVFNGEIYNFQELAAELNISLKTSSDTEVLIEAFAKWGVKFVKKLNGMFAIAIFCKSDGTLYLFRDRMGIKPLFYYFHNKQLVFASELKSILALNTIQENKSINKQALRTFLHVGYIPEPLTIYTNVFKFPKGSFAKFDGNQLEFEKYWDSRDKVNQTVIKNENEAKEELKALIKDSVRYRLIADVPYGTFLSGGIDSSLVSAVAQQTTNQQLKTFSIGFDDPKFNETEFSRKVANHIQSDHHEFILTEQDALKLVPDVFAYYDEPYADASAIPTMLVSKMAKQHVTMTLSGDGGDELFHGYGMYNWAKRFKNPLIFANRKLLAKALSLGSSRHKRVGKLLNYNKAYQFKAHVFSQEQYYFSGNELDNLLGDNSDIFGFKDDYSALSRKLSAAEEQALFDINYYLPDDLLTKVDRASMRYSLETRVPLLDHRIVEFALNVDAKLKVVNGDSKHLLKQVLYDYVPKEIFDRPKWGFGIPLNRWLKTELKPMVDDYLSQERIEKAGFVKYSVVNNLKTRFFSDKEDYLYNRLWVLICLHKWYFDIYGNMSTSSLLRS